MEHEENFAKWLMSLTDSQTEEMCISGNFMEKFLNVVFQDKSYLVWEYNWPEIKTK